MYFLFRRVPFSALVLFFLLSPFALAISYHAFSPSCSPLTCSLTFCSCYPASRAFALPVFIIFIAGRFAFSVSGLVTKNTGGR